MCGAWCMMESGADAGGDGGEARPLSLLFFQASIPLSSAAKAQGCVPAQPPSNAAPLLLGPGCLCFTFKLVLAASMT